MGIVWVCQCRIGAILIASAATALQQLTRVRAEPPRAVGEASAAGTRV
eukprot:SAG31_NODE_12001_length_978_cov_1.566553_1_plen_47_part_10